MLLNEQCKARIRADSNNTNVGPNDACGRCMRKNHAMRDCGASSTSCWHWLTVEEGAAAENYYRELRRAWLAGATTGTNIATSTGSQLPRLLVDQPHRPGASYAAASGGGSATARPSATQPVQTGAPALVKQVASVPINLTSGNPRTSTAPAQGKVVHRSSTNKTILEGSENSKYSVWANYVHVPKIPQQIFVYSITNHHDFKKEKDNSTGRRVLSRQSDWKSIFDELNSQYLGPLLATVSWATDYRTLWTDKLIFKSTPERRTFDVDFISHGGERHNPLRVEVAYTKHLNSIPNNLRQKQVEDCSEEIAALNALVTHPASLARHPSDFSVTPVGPNKFFVNEKFRVLKSAQSSSHDSAAFRAVRGYFTSVRPSKASGVLLNVNTATSAFLPPCRVSGILNYVSTSTDLDAEIDLDDVERWLRGCQLYVTYKRKDIPGRAVPINHARSRLKTFQNFGSTIKDQMFYDKKNAQDPGTSVLDYFSTEYPGLTGLDPEGLSVNVAKIVDRDANMRSQCSNGAIWIPAQLLEIVANQTVKGQLPPTLTASMISAALRQPAENARLIVREGLDVLRVPGVSTQAVQRPQFSIGNSLVVVPAEFLESPWLQYRNTTGYNVKKPYDASWNLTMGWKLHTGGVMDQINVFNLYHALLHQGFDRTNTMRGNLVVRIRHHGIYAVNAGTTGSGPLSALSTFWSNTAQGSASATFVALPDKSQGTYASIRRMSDLIYGVNSLCAVTANNKIPYYPGGNLAHGQPIGFQNQHLDNLVMKFNIKSDGLNHALEREEVQQLLGANSREGTIVFGADVGHPGKGSLAGVPSIACVVASIDRDLQKYPGSMRLQAGGQEIIEDMKAMVLERLEAWVDFRSQNPIDETYNNHHATGDSPTILPASILFYRDGVSESQFAEVMDRGVTASKSAFYTLATRHNQPSAKIKVTFVVVGKRHHTRFYPRTDAEASKNRTNGNTRPGLLVEDIVTTPHRYNFYLQSHAAIKGTARSAHYHVLLDEMDFGETNKRLANLTNVLCYCFARALKGVSYVAPAYIADRMCERGRVYLRPWKAGVSFKLPAQSNGGTWDKAAIMRWKKTKALEVARSAVVRGVSGQMERVWGTYDETVGRWNPWQARLDGVMFWM